MSVQTEHYPLKSELDFTVRDSQSPLTVRAISLALTKQDNQLIACRLSLQVSPQLYQRIETEALFNLTPDVRTPPSGVEFHPELDIAIETGLKPDFLPHLAEHAATIDKAATYLLSLRQEQPHSPLLSTENWLALSIKQQQESGEMGYRTVWSYVSPKALAGEASSSAELSEGITNFFKDVVGSRLDTVAKEFSNETLGAISYFSQEIAQNIPEPIPQDTTYTQPLFQAVVNFFTQDDWSFTRIQGEQALRLGFQGENGAWNCYAQTREKQEQFIFYSLCPLLAPEDKRTAVAEFITRANDGMIIGNFEMDFNDGEIRYKTSIDIDGDELTSDIIKRLVYANVTMMDDYLPGIIAVIEKDVSPMDAIAQIEGA
jgi:hypothetical protein